MKALGGGLIQVYTTCGVMVFANDRNSAAPSRGVGFRGRRLSGARAAPLLAQRASRRIGRPSPRRALADVRPRDRGRPWRPGIPARALSAILRAFDPWRLDRDPRLGPGVSGL